MNCNINIYTDYLISSTGQTSATGLSRLYEGKITHDQVTRFLTQSYLDSSDLWKKSKPIIRQYEQKENNDTPVVLIVDDCILEKPHTDPNAMVCTHWDHSQARYVKGVNFVSLLFQAEDISLPIAAQLIEKDLAYIDASTGKTKFKSPITKNEYLQKMLKVAQNQVDYKYLLADSWYSSADNMNTVIGLKHDFIFGLESSRTVALSEMERKAGQFSSLDKLTFPDKTALRVYLRSVKEAVVLVKQIFTNKDGKQSFLYLVSSDTNLDYDKITTIYQRRWKVEEYHKSLKQNTSMGKSPTKTPDTQANHFFASILAFIKLETLKIKLSLGHFRIKAGLYQVGLKAMQEQLNLISA